MDSQNAFPFAKIVQALLVRSKQLPQLVILENVKAKVDEVVKFPAVPDPIVTNPSAPLKIPSP